MAATSVADIIERDAPFVAQDAGVEERTSGGGALAAIDAAGD